MHAVHSSVQGRAEDVPARPRRSGRQDASRCGGSGLGGPSMGEGAGDVRRRSWVHPGGGRCGPPWPSAYLDWWCTIGRQASVADGQVNVQLPELGNVRHRTLREAQTQHVPEMAQLELGGCLVRETGHVAAHADIDEHVCERRAWGDGTHDVMRIRVEGGGVSQVDGHLVFLQVGAGAGGPVGRGLGACGEGAPVIGQAVDDHVGDLHGEHEW
ncbi:hypothetical protein C2E23DRAFT_597053 [Lenzites betulinus]|nr:hypothetical protein C2E23DRAFT_597053 [Lenzites betulinus]